MAVDLLEYLRGDGRLYELVNNLGTAEVCQTQTEAKNVFYHVKNSQWEELWADDVYIYRGTDTSPGNGELYLLSENNHYGSAWVPRWFEIGQVYRRSATVIWRRKDNGQPIPSKPTGVAVTYLRLEQIYTQLTFQSGIQLQDVAELHAMLDDGGKPAAATWEKYFYARGFGLVAFQDMIGGFQSYIAQKFTPATMPQRVREVISWLTPLQKRYYLPDAPATTPTGSFELTQIPADSINVRSYPDVNAKDLGDLQKGDVVTLNTPEVSGWVKVSKGNESGWVSRQNGAVVFTPSDQPVPPPDQPPGLPDETVLGQFTITKIPSNWVNVRDYPSTTGNDIGDLHKGDTVTLYTPEVDGWVYVEMADLHGWVSKQDGAVVFTAVDQPLPPDPLPPLPNETAVGPYTVTRIPSTWVNVRAYPDEARGADIGDLHQGDEVTLYKPEVNGWVFVEMGSTRGWVSRQSGAVVFTAVAAGTPTLPHDPLPDLPTVTPLGQFTLSQLPSTWVNVRAYPDAVNGADVGDLHQGDVVTLFTPDVNDWVYIEMGDTHGWVARQNGTVAFTPYTNGNGATATAPASASAIVPLNASAESAGGSMPTSRDDAIRMRDAFQHVEEGARKVRTELERLISRMRD